MSKTSQRALSWYKLGYEHAYTKSNFTMVGDRKIAKRHYRRGFMDGLRALKEKRSKLILDDLEDV